MDLFSKLAEERHCVLPHHFHLCGLLANGCRWAAHDTFDLLLAANQLGFFYGLAKCLQRRFNVLKVWSPWVASFILLLYLEPQAY